jgi:hypothetical protein
MEQCGFRQPLPQPIGGRYLLSTNSGFGGINRRPHPEGESRVTGSIVAGIGWVTSQAGPGREARSFR